MALYRRTSDIGIRTLSDNGFENKEMQVDPVGVGGGHEDEESDWDAALWRFAIGHSIRKREHSMVLHVSRLQ